MLLISFFLVGLPQSYVRFFNKYKKNNLKNQFNYNFFILVILVFIFSFSTSFIVFLNQYKSNYKFIIVLSLIVGVSVVMQQVCSIIRAKEKTFLHAMVLGINDILVYGLPIITIYAFGTTVTNYFISRLIVPLVILLIILSMIRREIKISKFDNLIIREMLYFGVPLILVSIGGTIFSSGDRLVINHIIGSEGVAVYSVSSKIAHAIQQVVIFPINMVLFPMYTRTWEEEGRVKTEQLLSKWFNLYMFVAIVLIAGSYSVKEEIICILSNSTYIEGAIQIPVLLTGLLIYGGYYFISAGFFVRNKTFKLGIVVIVSSILNIILDYLMGITFGVVGVAMATAIAYIIFLLISYNISRKIITIRIDFFQIIKFIISAVGMVIFLNFIPIMGNMVLDLLLKVLLGGIVYVSLNFRFIKSQIKLGEI